MYSHDYSKEIALNSREKQISIPLALLLCVCVGAGIWYGFKMIKPAPPPMEAPVAQVDR
jgi:hypothetical protein